MTYRSEIHQHEADQEASKCARDSNCSQPLQGATSAHRGVFDSSRTLYFKVHNTLLREKHCLYNEWNQQRMLLR